MVECSLNGINAEFDEYGFIIENTEFRNKIIDDDLDKLSWSRHELDPDKEDFKRWDYPECELSQTEIDKIVEKE